MSTELMEYLPTQPQGGPGKYHGKTAFEYDAKRMEDPKWKIEQASIEGMLLGLADGSWILDAPCGTGRFFDFYQEHSHIVRALDISDDMLNQAKAKVREEHVSKFLFAPLDIRGTQLEDKSVDAAVMCRLTRWIGIDENAPLEMQQSQGCQGTVDALKELQRVTRQKIIFTARVADHPHARSYELIHSALTGWKIARDDEGVDPNYRIIMLEPV